MAVRLICPFSFESALSLIPSAETFPEKVISGPSFDIQTGISPVDNRINDYLGDRYFEGVTVPANNGNNIMTILTIVWIIGILLLVAYTIISYRRLHREIDTAVHYKDNIFQSENVSSPFVLGIINPRIYLPFSMNEQDLEHVVIVVDGNDIVAGGGGGQGEHPVLIGQRDHGKGRLGSDGAHQDLHAVVHQLSLIHI